MSLVKEWTTLLTTQTEDSFEDFWKEYSTAEMKIYEDILSNKQQHYKGNFKECADKYDVRPVIFCGFLDGIQDSLASGQLDMEGVDESTDFDFNIDFEKLYYNMHKAEATHLYNLKSWENVLSEEERATITKEYKKSKTLVKGEKIGRNQPCPCGRPKTQRRHPRDQQRQPAQQRRTPEDRIHRPIRNAPRENLEKRLNQPRQPGILNDAGTIRRLNPDKRSIAQAHEPDPIQVAAPWLNLPDHPARREKMTQRHPWRPPRQRQHCFKIPFSADRRQFPIKPGLHAHLVDDA